MCNTNPDGHKTVVVVVVVAAAAAAVQYNHHSKAHVHSTDSCLTLLHHDEYRTTSALAADGEVMISTFIDLHVKHRKTRLCGCQNVIQWKITESQAALCTVYVSFDHTMMEFRNSAKFNS